jgi:predicted RNA-binding protein associated with RNAse of E/G family
LSAKEGLLVRIDDKLKRIKNGSLEKDDEDVINDLIGYLVLLKIQSNEEKYKRNRDARIKNRIANED